MSVELDPFGIGMDVFDVPFEILVPREFGDVPCRFDTPPQQAPSSPEFYSGSPSPRCDERYVKREPEDMDTASCQYQQAAPVPAASQIGHLMRAGKRESMAALAMDSSSSGADVPEYENRKRPNKLGRNMTEDERIVRRRKKNREAAQQSRLRKRMKLESLEAQLAEQKAIHNSEKIQLELENESLRKQVEYMREVLRSARNSIPIAV